MATYLVLFNFTDQGIRNVKDTINRANAFKEVANSHGADGKDLYWTLGQHDMVAIVDVPDDIVITALGLALGQLGNVRTQTLRAFSQSEMDVILSKLP